MKSWGRKAEYQIVTRFLAITARSCKIINLQLNELVQFRYRTYCMKSTQNLE